MSRTRFQLNSNSAHIDVYKRLPSAEPNKTYLLRIEQVVVPELRDSILLNKPLFTLERRVMNGVNQEVADELEVEAFAPQNVKTEIQFVYQLNEYLRSSLLRLVSEGVDELEADVNIFQYATPPRLCETDRQRLVLRHNRNGSR